ncbi:MAG: hypothetical protein CO145_01680 [Candidatus Nealsonbacteria bacterium CG_4_9_14_3_um_filter_37_13]|uniref:Uncharacterized protein n=1 Tax=Candidatus Nealsonbacteria bacterium CG_4_9_14_3_um_filter_37_13 TaxID=1974695 RepID=A0A2M7Z507_9BACT|nr:MAG: hypothetical protein CO145_01680 [Candidatus Nealsonbacteria bacterium CG_4_9_14_3_um_filter_37_13]
MPAFPRAAFGEVGLPPVTAIEHLTLQNFLITHGSLKNTFLHWGFAHIVFTLGTFITPLNGLLFPFSDFATFNLVSWDGGFLFLLLTRAAQLWLQ